jgi:DNA polymerase epsilon subunit 3
MSDQSKQYELPVAAIGRIVKAALPDNIQVGKEAKTCFAKAAGLFILYLTDSANTFARANKRQTVSAADIMSAVEDLEFEEFIEPLHSFLDAYRKEHATNKPKAVRKPRAKKEKAAAADGDGDGGDGDGDGDGDGESAAAAAAASPSKKRKADAVDDATAAAAGDGDGDAAEASPAKKAKTTEA